jgi:endonuclease/exonuclease/phosphatase family metal-dependent hydrolase
MKLIFGTYNFEFGGFDDGSPARLRRQLQMLNSVQAHAWAFQECSNWRDDRTQTLGMAEAALGMRGFIARSNRGPGGDVAVFIRESAGIHLVEQRHEEQPVPYWHAVAHIVCRLDGFGLIRFASAHLAPSAPTIRLGEAESFQLIAEKNHLGPLVAGGDWNARPPGDPALAYPDKHPGKVRRKNDTAAAEALEEFMIDVGSFLGIRTPTVGHQGEKMPYQCDRTYTTLPGKAIKSFWVVKEENPDSDHLAAVSEFDLDSA